MGASIEFVEFSPSGALFVLSGARAVEVWSVEKAGIVKTIACQSKPTALCWLDDDNLLIGMNDGNLAWNRLHNDEVRADVLLICFQRQYAKRVVFLCLAASISNVRKSSERTSLPMRSSCVNRKQW